MSDEKPVGAPPPIPPAASATPDPEAAAAASQLWQADHERRPVVLNGADAIGVLAELHGMTPADFDELVEELAGETAAEAEAAAKISAAKINKIGGAFGAGSSGAFGGSKS